MVASGKLGQEGGGCDRKGQQDMGKDSDIFDKGLCYADETH